MITRLKANMTPSPRRLRSAQPRPVPSVSPRPNQTLRFEDTLAGSARDRSLPKRERTRYLILAIVARHVQASPATRPTVEAILQEAGLSRGTFYNYFNDMDECLSSLLTLFIQQATYNTNKGPKKKKSNLEAIFEANLAYCRAYESNAGLFALFSQFSSSDENLLRLRENLNAEMVERIVSVVAHRRGRAFDEQERRRFEGALRMLVAMTIEVLRERFIHEDALMKRSFPTVKSLAGGLTEIWYRTMMAYEDPAAYPAISFGNG